MLFYQSLETHFLLPFHPLSRLLSVNIFFCFVLSFHASFIFSCSLLLFFPFLPVCHQLGFSICGRCAFGITPEMHTVCDLHESQSLVLLSFSPVLVLCDFPLYSQIFMWGIPSSPLLDHSELSPFLSLFIVQLASFLSPSASLALSSFRFVSHLQNVFVISILLIWIFV